MRSQLKDLIVPLIFTILTMMVLKIFSTSVLPVIGLDSYIVPFNILIVLYLGFKLQTIWLPILIFSVQYSFSLFSVEGWELGTIAGILISVAIAYLRDIIHLSSSFMIIFFTQIFQSVWFIIVSILIYLKTGEVAYIVERFWRFIPESIVISLIAPVAFILLDKFWQMRKGASLGDEG